MKKIVLLTIIMAEIFFNTDLTSAAPSFGTVMPQSGKWTGGGEANLIFARYVKDYQNSKSSQYFYKLSFGFADWFSFDAKLGMGDVTEKTVTRGSVYYNAGFAGGYGWRAKLFEDKKTGIRGLWGFEHTSTHPQQKKIKEVPYSIIWDDWQFQVLALREIGNVYPYCGMKWSLLYLIRKIDANRTRRRSGDPMGLIVGTDVRMNDYIYVNIEGRFFDETALSTGFTIRY